MKPKKKSTTTKAELAALKAVRVPKKVQDERDALAVKIRMREITEQHDRGLKVSPRDMEGIKTLSNQNSSHRTPITEHRFNRQIKHDTTKGGMWDKGVFDKEMNKQKRALKKR